MKYRLSYLAAGVIAGAGVATLVVASYMGGSSPSNGGDGPDEPPPAQPMKAEEDESGSQMPERRATGGDESDEEKQPDRPKRAKKKPKKKKGDNPPGPGYVKTGEVTKTIDLSEQQKKKKGDSPAPPRPEVVELGGSIESTLGSPDDAPEDFEFQTNFHIFEAEKDQTLELEVASISESDKGIQPLVILWKPDETGAPDEQIDFARAKEGERSTTLTHSFEETSRYLISVDDARNVPIDKDKPDSYYGGEDFTYQVSLSEDS